jgi:hypothetical protein
MNPNCPWCGWPTYEPFQTVSRHRTSEGLVAWTRCPCGRLRVVRAAAPSIDLARESPGAPAARDAAGSPGPSALVGGSVVVALAGAGALSVLSAPPPVLLACLALAGVSGLLTGVWGWLAQYRAPAAAVGLGLRGALVGGSAAALLVGLLGLFGPATVVVLPAGYLVAAALVWLAGWRPGDRRARVVARRC